MAGLLITVGLGLGITKLDFATGQDSYLNKSDQVYKDNLAYQDLFGGQAMLTVITMNEGHTVDELFASATRAQFTTLHDSLTNSGKYQGVITPLTIMQFSENLVKSPDGNPLNSVAAKATLGANAKETPGTPQAAARDADFKATTTRLLAIPTDKQTLDNPEWVKFLLYDNQGQVRKALRSFIPDDRHAQVIVRLKGNQSIDDEGVAAVAVKVEAAKLKIDNATTVTTGASILLKDINDYLRGGMLTLGGIAVAIMVVILLVFFNVRWRLLPLAVILIGVVWAFGLAGYLGIPLTIVTIAGLPVMLGVGIDYAIQMHASRRRCWSAAPTIRCRRRRATLGPALLVVTFDAIFAFAALRFAKVPMIRAFGLLLAVGIAVICFASIIIPVAILGIREFKSPTSRKTDGFEPGYLGRFTERLGSLPSASAIPLIIASLVIFFGGLAVEDKLTLQTDPIEWVNQKSQTIKDIKKLDSEVHSSSEMGVFARTDDVFSDEFVAFAHTFTHETLAKYPGLILTGSSIETAVGDLIEVPGASDIAPTGADVKAAFDVAPPDLSGVVGRGNGKAFNIVFRTGVASLEERAPMVREVRSQTHPPDGHQRRRRRAWPWSASGLLDNLEANRILLTYLAILFVFLFLAVRLRSIVRSLLSLVPVLIAVGTASLVAWALSLKLSPMTAVGGPLVIAACTEFTSLILLRFIEERRRGLEPKEAVDVAASRTGRAFIVSGMTAIAGVAVLSFSSLPLLRDFGRIVAMNVTVALLSALVVLPPMLVWADKRNWVSRGLVKPVVEPYIETPPLGGVVAPAD